ncbi:MAG: CRTAC1 family protein [Alphaproteobacteria bacterium]|nr:CRTAC1 family protein [Alphaproteobacteria bacterium]
MDKCALNQVAGSVWRTPSAVALAWLLGAAPAAAQSVNFTEVSQDPAMGLSYSRAPSYSVAGTYGLQEGSLISPLPFEVFAVAPHRSQGLPGVAILDHDGDGDADVYITNGPGAPNSLFSNQLVETGEFRFVDVGATSGADATAQDTNGVCFGDIDNDGDEDILTLGRGEANRLHVNDGTGHFTHIPMSGLEGGTYSHIGCSMGDIDGDGLLDVVVGNSFDMSTQLPLIVFPYSNEPTQLYVNQGDGTFADVSASSGILVMDALTDAPPDATTITWTIAMVDVDLDGDMDILQGDDQGPVPETTHGGWDRAYMHVFINDGTGHFVDEVVNLGRDSVASWMGVDFADFDHDGNLDWFGANFGDYNAAPLNTPYEFHHFATRAHFGNGDGTFTERPVVEPTSFSWGTAVADLDNDGDHDATYHGGLDMVMMKLADNPGVVMINDGDGNFSTEIGGYDANYSHRSVQGLASGDLNQDGFIDIVTASDNTLPYNAPLLLSQAQYGHKLDSTAFWTPMFMPDPGGSGGFVWNGIRLEPGQMTMEINNADSGNPAVRVSATGSVGVTTHGRHNRGGLGAIVTFEPLGHHADPMMQPITGGSSFLSQHESVAHFGLGNRHSGTVEVLWNGGHRNRLYNVQAGEVIDFPEIGCSYDTTDTFTVYMGCVEGELGQLRSAGVIGWSQYHRYRTSMMVAYLTH